MSLHTLFDQKGVRDSTVLVFSRLVYVFWELYIPADLRLSFQYSASFVSSCIYPKKVNGETRIAF